MGGSSDTFLGRLFAKHGGNVARFPVVYVLVPILFAGILCVGFKELMIDSDPDVIWVPPASTTAQQKRFFDAAFDPFFRINQIIVTLEDPSLSPSSGALSRPYMQAVLDLQNAIVNATASDGTTLDNVCYKPIAGAGCLIETPLDYVFSDGVVLASLNDSDIQNAVDCLTLPQLQASGSGGGVGGGGLG
jgi:Niemann-Pick C1 protein